MSLPASPLATRMLFHLGPLSISETVVTTWALMAVMAIGARLLTRSLSVLQPGRTQILCEWVILLIDEQIRGATRLEPERYRPLIATLFLFILLANLSSLIPGVEPPTGRLETDAAMALIVFCASLYFGISRRGLWGYLRSFAHPSWVMIPLNLVEQITRTFSLMLRLFGNVMAGVFVVGIILSLAGLLVPIPFMALDVMTGIIQAYIFSVLAIVFIGAAAGDGTDTRSEKENT